MMIKAGALYFAIVIAFFIAIVSASLLMLAAHYRNTYLKEIRFTRLLNNLNSGVELALADIGKLEGTKVIDLYADGTDSLVVERKQWGVFDLALVRTFILQDTLKRAMLIGTGTDSTAVYLSDEDRPLLLGGTTKISGNAYLPKSGVKKSYVDGKPYANEKLIYDGRILHSSRSLKAIDKYMVDKLKAEFTKKDQQRPLLNEKTITQSFFAATLTFDLIAKANLKNVELKGNIILYADSSITISASAQLEGIQLYAPYIKIEDGFKGNCQLFATDSIVIGKKVKLNYPSVAAVIRTEQSADQPHLVLGNEVNFEGILFSYEAKRSPLQTMVTLGKDTKVKGEIYSTGLLVLSKGTAVDGKISCNRLMMYFSGALYENFLIDVNLNRKARSPYYLSSRLFEPNLQYKVLKWMD